MTDRRKVFSRRRLTWVGATVLMASILSFPAALYLWQRPELPNLLSLLLTLGFFGALLALIRPAWLQLLICLPVLALNAIEIVHIILYGDLISLGGVEAIFHVDPQEAREFASAHAWLFVLCGVVVALLCILAIVKARVDGLRLTTRLSIGATVLIVPVAILAADLVFFGSKRDVYLPTRIVEHYAAYLGVNPLTHTISGIAATLSSRREFADLRALRAGFGFEVAPREAPADRELYIVVIGESSRRLNWSLYGYDKLTNPALMHRRNLVAFQDAISPSVTTSRSVPLSFSFATVGNFEDFYRTKSFVSAFREAGFRTYWLSNQGAHRSAVGNHIALLMDDAHEVVTTNFGFWNSVLDGELLNPLRKMLADPAPRKLIVVHTLGSHTNYSQRFPAGWAPAGWAAAASPAASPALSGEDAGNAKAEAIGDYDKSVSYTDWFLDQVIEFHAETGLYGAMIYFSDHGQRLYDDESAQKGHGFGGLKSFDVEIPLLIWTSESFVALSEDKLSMIRGNARRPVTTDHLAESMLGLAGIDVAGVEQSRNFFGSSYQETERQVLTVSGELRHYPPPSN